MSSIKIGGGSWGVRIPHGVYIIEGLQRRSQGNLGSSNVENATMVSTSTATVVRISSSASQERESGISPTRMEFIMSAASRLTIVSNSANQEAFQQKQFDYWQHLGGAKLPQIMSHSSKNGTAGTKKGAEIPLLEL